MNVPKLMLRAGLLVLAFALVGFFGNFVRWRQAKQTKATILGAQEQWTRRAPGNINLELEYSVDRKTHRARASVASSRLPDGVVNGIDIYYMEDDPDQVIPVEVLKSKQRFIIFAAALGMALTGLGLFLKRRHGAPAPPIPSNAPAA